MPKRYKKCLCDIGDGTLRGLNDVVVHVPDDPSQPVSVSRDGRVLQVDELPVPTATRQVPAAPAPAAPRSRSRSIAPRGSIPRGPRKNTAKRYCVFSHKGNVVNCYDRKDKAENVARSFSKRAGAAFTVTDQFGEDYDAFLPVPSFRGAEDD